MPLKGWVSISVREESRDKLKELFDKHADKLEELGIENISDFIDYAANKIESPEVKPRFEHFNVFDDHATIIDHALGDRLINVYLKDHKLWCEFDESFGCIHVGYAHSIKKVQEALSR
ncbi:MAG: hypothetical protein M1503_11590 [Thaumarchaeota archaeon]|nr:hypothetical protein [Nitrososphaerota archaeon]MCL5318885.1 hypothetical protein [Nitrososphaerota archaeon]